MIKIEHLVKYYGQNLALDDISFEVEKGEIVGLLGPNGAGKSTTMNILTGYLSSTAGHASVDGIDILADPIAAKRRIGYLPEIPPVYLDMTVGEYLDFVYDLKGCRLPRREHLESVAATVRIGGMQNRLIRSLSKGYRQRVGIAMALVGDPGVIIFDEPTVGLDPKQVIEIRSLIRSLGKTHTVILSTHILQEVQAVCDRIIIIDKGRIVADEKTEDIRAGMKQGVRLRLRVVGAQPEVSATLRGISGVLNAECTGERDGDAYLYRLDAARDVRREVFRTLADKGMTLIGMETPEVSVEDVFLSVTDRETKGRTRVSTDAAAAADTVFARARERREENKQSMTDERL